MSENDDKLWQFINRDTTPLPGKEIHVSEDDAQPSDVFTEKTEIAPPLLPRSSSVPTTALPLVIDRLEGLDAATQRKVRRGQLSYEAKLDLHGQRLHEAEQSLSHFIEHAYQSGKRSVLIITGKGNREAGSGVIREHLPMWLNAPILRSKIVAASTAHAKHGGTGAFMVLLKSKR